MLWPFGLIYFDLFLVSPTAAQPPCGRNWLFLGFSFLASTLIAPCSYHPHSTVAFLCFCALLLFTFASSRSESLCSCFLAFALSSLACRFSRPFPRQSEMHPDFPLGCVFPFSHPWTATWKPVPVANEWFWLPARLVARPACPSANLDLLLFSIHDSSLHCFSGLVHNLRLRSQSSSHGSIDTPDPPRAHAADPLSLAHNLVRRPLFEPGLLPVCPVSLSLHPCLWHDCAQSSVSDSSKPRTELGPPLFDTHPAPNSVPLSTQLRPLSPYRSIALPYPITS